MGDVNKGETGRGEDVGMHANFLYLPLNFPLNLKLLKTKVY